MQTLTLPFYTAEMVTVAMRTVAALVREGVTFKATTTSDNSELVITFTGGY